VAALDLGAARIGVAVTDVMRLTVRPLGTVAVVGPKRDALAIRELLAGRRVVKLLIGLPADEDGAEGPAALRARETGDDLARRLQIPHEFVDEYGTTAEAAELLREDPKRAGGEVDALAAALILEAWLRSHPSGD
jgi:putative Holliday junction resolvase